ncbi:MAG: esterase-like activity of phytase family protein [Bacteroidota bacterium]
MNNFKWLALAGSVLMLSGAGFLLSPEQTSISSLRFLGEYEVPFNKSFQSTTIGGLSGVDYDPVDKIYYLISDDRSQIHDARFYTAKVYFNQKGIDSVRFMSVHTMLQQDGKSYPSSKQDAKNTPDPEAIRLNSATRQLVWSSEGERTLANKKNILTDPMITVMDLNGNHKEAFPIPSNLSMQEIEKGPRKNGVLEGLTFSSDFKTLFTCSEVPLHEDGPEADIKENNAFVRLFQYDVVTKKNTAQYAYRLDPLPTRHIRTAFKINGIPDILYLEQNKLLVVERSFSTGRLPCTVKVFIADLGKADNIIKVASLKETPPANIAIKKLLLNMDDLGIYIDNVEGVTFGPDLPNGHRTLIFVTDNNFVPLEKTQFLLFEVIP